MMTLRWTRRVYPCKRPSTGHCMQYHARHHCSMLHAVLQAAHIAMILNLYPESLPTLVNCLRAWMLSWAEDDEPLEIAHSWTHEHILDLASLSSSPIMQLPKSLVFISVLNSPPLEMDVMMSIRCRYREDWHGSGHAGSQNSQPSYSLLWL